MDLQAATIGDIGGYHHVTFIESQDSIEMITHKFLGDITNPIKLSQDEPWSSQIATQTMIYNVYTSLAKNAIFLMKKPSMWVKEFNMWMTS